MNNGRVDPRSLGLRSDSFVSGFSTDLLPRVIANIEGGQKCGKDHFALTAPDPIVIFNFDQGLEGTIEKFLRRGKRIVVAGDPRIKTRGKFPSYHFARPVPEQGERRRDQAYLNRVKKTAYPIWERFINDLDEFYRSEARTGIVDTGGAAYNLARFAFFGMEKGRPDPKDDPYGQKSGDMKAIFQGLVTDGYNYDKNVLWLHRVKEKWEGNAPTGRYEASGYKEIGYEVQVNVRVGKRKYRGEQEFFAKIGDCRLNATMEGEEFVGKEVEFAVVMAELTGTKEELWR